MKLLNYCKRIIFLVPWLCGMLYAEGDLITKLEVHGSSMKCTINPAIRKAYLTGDFFVEYDEDIKLEAMSYEILTMPVVLNLFSLVWFSGETYYVDSMDYDVYESLEKLKGIFKFVYPENSWSGTIIPRKLVSLAPQFLDIRRDSSSRAMLFSGGLDSTASFFEHIDEDLVLITAWGQFDLPLDSPRGWQGRKKAIEAIARKYGKRNSFIRSNYSEIFDGDVVNFLYPRISNWRLFTVEELSWAGLTTPILISKKCPVLYVPSGGNWLYNVLDRMPHVEEMARFAGFSMIADQFDLTRFDKAELIVDTCKRLNVERPFIKVCYLPNANCGACRKCCMTMISLLALGETLAEYGYTCTNEEAVSNTLKFFDGKMGYFNAWNFKEMQLKIRKMVERYPERKRLLQPFLSFDMRELQVNDRKYCVKVNWSELRRYIPQLKVPRHPLAEFSNIEV